ncbi:hypothetical protein PORY_001474 [Pneumocystis oryctolagi]|uniref:Uncharacterized protein n=1 Tax=Pneumocystis oryctolagi TaxID=42067 RepID=A0ACB7CC34_9ASCO|nr:hypothetical protein PORY_001474 [Pneumocystis oryctolagi]
MTTIIEPESPKVNRSYSDCHQEEVCSKFVKKSSKPTTLVTRHSANIDVLHHANPELHLTPFTNNEKQCEKSHSTNQGKTHRFVAKYPSMITYPNTIEATPQFAISSTTVLPSAFPRVTHHLDIANHPIQNVLQMLSSLLLKITQSNDHLHRTHSYRLSASQSPNSILLLSFHARNIPSISIHAYLVRILKYCPATNEVFLSLLVYFDRMSKQSNNKLSRVSSRNEQFPVFAIDSYNIHRLIIAGITVASKFFSDIFYTNSRYAKVGGLPLSELNHLELQFLLMNDFRLMIPLKEMQQYGDQLLRYWLSTNACKHE